MYNKFIMYGKISRVMLGDLIIAFSKALDYVDRTVANHHLRVAVIADRIAETLNLTRNDRVTIFMAAALHDVGVFTLSEKLQLSECDFINTREHAERGYLLMKDFSMFTEVADVIRYHHVNWDEGSGQFAEGCPIPIGSHVIHLADRIDTLINRQTEILKQKDSIVKAIKSRLNSCYIPEIVEAFCEIAQKEYFWFDVSSPEIDETVSDLCILPQQEVSVHELAEIAKLFSHIIDYRSNFTAVHSAGVSAVAGLLAQLIGFSEVERRMMGIAGYLHDVGKLSVATELLEKPAKLTDEEFNVMKSHVYHSYRILSSVKGLDTITLWAALHHERMDGKGYPFRLTGNDIPLGSRIMAVADVFTAVSEDRPYRKGLSEKEALLLIEVLGNNNALDKDVVRVAANCISEMNDVRLGIQVRAQDDYLAIRQTTV
ncbi:MAG: HD domain-containing protein [Nitrospirae bacterium]|nr:HD domain-containing protein [Nitrospirota bacterium]